MVLLQLLANGDANNDDDGEDDGDDLVIEGDGVDDCDDGVYKWPSPPFRLGLKPLFLDNPPNSGPLLSNMCGGDGESDGEGDVDGEGTLISSS